MSELMNNETLKKLHKVEIEILDEFVCICKENNLQYFLIGGTLLGTVRHKGFIPWDDDLDVAMPRNDYEKFLKIANKELKNDYMIDNKDTNSKYYLNFTKIRKNNTIFEQDFQVNYNGPKGIWLDVFPLDEAKGDTILIKFQRKLSNIIFSLLHYKNGFFLNKKHLLIKKIIGKIAFFKNIVYLNLQEKVLKLQNNKNYEYIVNLASTYDYKKELMKKSIYFPSKKLTFEGKEYNVPNKYEYYLKQVYGDYMKLPPKDKQITHNPVKLIFNIEENKK